MIPDEYTHSQYPNTIDAKLADFFINMTPDFTRHDMYSQHLAKILEYEYVIQDMVDSNGVSITDTGPLKMYNIKTSMVNYNYGLGFRVNRWKLRIGLLDLGITARYENSVDLHVTVTFPCIIPDELLDRVKLKGVNKGKHSFLVYRSGLVTQSGPHEILNRERYIAFISILRSLREQVEQIEDVDE